MMIIQGPKPKANHLLLPPLPPKVASSAPPKTR